MASNPPITDEELHSYGMTREEYNDRVARSDELWKERGEALPKTSEDIDKFLDDIPLFSSKAPSINAGTDQSHENAILGQILKETTPNEKAENLKDSGNDAFKLWRKGNSHRYDHAMQYYTQALECGATDNVLNSTIYSNRALLHLSKKNYGKCKKDADQAISLDHNNTKAHFRKAKALYALRKWNEAKNVATEGIDIIEQQIENAKNKGDTEMKNTAVNPIQKQLTAFKKLLININSHLETIARKKREKEDHRAQEMKKEEEKAILVKHALVARKIRIGQPTFANLIQQYDCQPVLDKNDNLHWPVLFLYPDHQQSDFVQDVHEKHRLYDHLSQMFPPKVPFAPWDTEKKYTLENLLVHYKIKNKQKQVDIHAPLQKLLTRKPRYIVPLVPTFYVTVKQFITNKKNDPNKQ